MNAIGWGLATVFATGAALLAAMILTENPPGANTTAPTAPVATTGGAAALSLVSPIPSVPATDLRQDWGDVREGGTRQHQGLDIAAPRGTPVVAVFDGRVEKLFVSERGGNTAYLRNDRGDWGAYYAHLDGYAPGLTEGQRLRRGDPVGSVGDSGNAGVGNTHLHFGLSRMARGQRWYEGVPVDPYPLLAGRGPRR